MQGVLCRLGKQLLVVSARSPRVSRGEAGLGVLGGLEPRPLVPPSSLHAAAPLTPG